MEVQKIACVNNAWFVMSFSVHTSGGLKTKSTDHYDIDQTRIIDLGNLPLEEGTDIWPVVSAVLGKTGSGPHVQFKKNNATATYTVTGTTLDYKICLIGEDICTHV